MHKKIAVLIRDFSTFGGGENNVAFLIEALNNKGIVPDLYSEKNPSNSDIKKYFNVSISYRFKQIPSNKSLFIAILSEIFLRHPLSRALRDYDFIYDFTNKPPVYYEHPHYLKYIYIIEDSRVLKESFLRKIQYILYSFFAHIGIKKFIKVSPQIINVTQSPFAQQEIKQKTGLTVPIVYPPVSFSPVNTHEEKKLRVISIGRISPEKRQLDVIDIAKALPNIPFIIIGKTDDEAYHQLLIKKVTKESIRNVTFLTDISKARLDKILHESHYFISTTIEEHFGIALIEAIAAGCIPFSHNSGAPINTINNPKLLFNSNNEAIKKINSFLNTPQSEKNKVITQLQYSLKKYNKSVFQSKMIEFLNSKEPAHKPHETFETYTEHQNK